MICVIEDKKMIQYNKEIGTKICFALLDKCMHKLKTN